MRGSFLINDRRYDLEVDPDETLLRLLRDRLQLTGTKEGCLEGECGACTVLVDGQPVDSCLTAALTVVGMAVTTIEGVSGRRGELTAMQEAIWKKGGIQCGFCTPGIVMTMTALLAENAAPTDLEIRQALAGNICRCTGYRQIVEAVAELARATQ